MRFPCKDCTDRWVGCHGTCQKYQEARKNWDKASAEAKKEKKLADELDDYTLRTAQKIRKRYWGIK